MTAIYKQAVQQKLRFPSVKGDLTTEQLFDLPLTSKSGFDLDSVAKIANAELKQEGEESFVATTASPRKAQLQLKLDVIKDVIAVKQAENEAQRQKLAKAEERRRLTEILANKQDAALQALTPEEIEARLKALGE